MIEKLNVPRKDMMHEPEKAEDVVRRRTQDNDRQRENIEEPAKIVDRVIELQRLCNALVHEKSSDFLLDLNRRGLLRVGRNRSGEIVATFYEEPLDDSRSDADPDQVFRIGGLATAMTKESSFVLARMLLDLRRELLEDGKKFVATTKNKVIGDLIKRTGLWEEVLFEQARKVYPRETGWYLQRAGLTTSEGCGGKFYFSRVPPSIPEAPALPKIPEEVLHAKLPEPNEDLSQKNAITELIREVRRIADKNTSGIRNNLQTGLRMVRIAKKLWDTNEPGRPVYGSVELDKIYTELNDGLVSPDAGYRETTHHKREIQPLGEAYNDNGRVALVFLPWGSDIDKSVRYGLIPRGQRAVAFTTPVGFINKDPHVTKRIFLNVVEDVERTVAAMLAEDPSLKFDVISYSAANGAGFYTANTILKKEHQGRFISIVSGSGIGREIFASGVLGAIREDVEGSGIPDGDAYNEPMYDKKRGFLLPIHHADKLPDDTRIYLGSQDRYIPAEFAIEIGETARYHNPNVQIIQYQFGHLGTALYVAHLEQLKQSKLVASMIEELPPNVVHQYGEMFKRRGIILPDEDVVIWSAVFTILCRSANAPENQKMLADDESQRTIEEIAREFLASILPETSSRVVDFLSKLSTFGRMSGVFATKAA